MDSGNRVFFLLLEIILVKILILIRCGSGIIINNYVWWLKELKKNEFCFFFASDINYDACFLTKKFSNYYQVYKK